MVVMQTYENRNQMNNKVKFAGAAVLAAGLAIMPGCKNDHTPMVIAQSSECDQVSTSNKSNDITYLKGRCVVHEGSSIFNMKFDNPSSFGWKVKTIDDKGIEVKMVSEIFMSETASKSWRIDYGEAKTLSAGVVLSQTMLNVLAEKSETPGTAVVRVALLAPVASGSVK